MKKVLLIGDSIRMGYDSYVKSALADTCEVYYPADNCQFAQYFLRHLDEWKNTLNLDETIDLVHWNVGLWDTLIMYDDGCLTPLDFYEYFIEKICLRMKLLFPHAIMIFATSTPVLEHKFPENRARKNADIRKYNEVAAEIVKKHGCLVNDLYSVVESVPETYYSDMTHLYTPQGTELLTNAVLKPICNALDIPYSMFDLTEYNRVKEIIGH